MIGRSDDIDRVFKGKAENLNSPQQKFMEFVFDEGIVAISFKNVYVPWKYYSLSRRVTSSLLYTPGFDDKKTGTSSEQSLHMHVSLRPRVWLLLSLRTIEMPY
jgi:tRNA U54 and U55 pseudouridine synthase Pus10